MMKRNAIILAIGIAGAACAAALLGQGGNAPATGAPAPSPGAGSPATRELAAVVLRDGWGALRGNRFDQSSDAAAIASIFGDTDGATVLLAGIDARRRRQIALLGEEVRDAMDAGDLRRAGRVGALVGRLAAPSTAAVSIRDVSPAVKSDGDDAAIEKARRHLRAGNPAQARASLLEAAENEESGRVRRLLEEIGRAETPEGSSAKEQP